VPEKTILPRIKIEIHEDREDACGDGCAFLSQVPQHPGNPGSPLGDPPTGPLVPFCDLFRDYLKVVKINEPGHLYDQPRRCGGCTAVPEE
jgi:hypothetical protein